MTGTRESHKQRNDEICSLYTEQGKTIYVLSSQFKISHERVRQILRKRGVLRKDRQQQTTSRDKFVGVEVTETAKQALRDESAKSGESMSELGAKGIDILLKERGYDVDKTAAKE